MKTIIRLIMFCCLGINLNAQTPQKMSYQAVVRNASGALVTNQAVGMKVSILLGSVSGTVVFSETYNPNPQTNANGLVSIEIGSGTPVTGTFTGINWASGPYYLKAETDPSGGTSYTVIGTSQLLSVPYALMGKTAETVLDNAITSGKILDGSIVTADLTNSTVTTDKLGNLAVSAEKIANMAVTTDKLANGSVTGAKIAQAGASSGQVLKWSGSLWEPGTDLTGAGATLPGGSSGQVQFNNAGAFGGNPNFFWDNTTMRLGIGTTTPFSPLHVVSSIWGASLQSVNNYSEGTGVAGYANSNEGYNYGVYGQSSSSAGYGIYGTNISSAGTTYGVKGSVSSPDGTGVVGESQGTGVWGIATNTNSANSGVAGESKSINGCGVFGYASTTTGMNFGVYGRSASSSGFGVLGANTASTGNTFGVKGTASSTSGTGVYGIGGSKGVKGEATNSGGLGVFGTSPTGTGVYGDGLDGVFGISSSSTPGYGIGVYGYASSATGTTYGAMGRSLSSSGTGIEGVAESVTGTTKGVSGNVNSANGYSGYFTGGKFYVSGRVGIGTLTPFYLLHAVSTAESAIKGETSTSSGTGVAGYATSTTGTTYGVIGQSSSPSGYGVYGSNSASTGSAYGVAGFTSSPDGYSGYFFGGKFYVYGKAGIGTTDPWAGLHVKGTEFPNSFVFVEASTGKDAGIRFYEGGTVKWHMFNNALAGGLQIYNSGGTPAIFVKQSNSFVGIATTTPAYNLEVIGTAGKTGGGSWSTSSDVRLKDVHGNYTKGLNEINALQPVLFNYKAGNARKLPANSEQTGFIAQDVQKVFPEAVSEGEDGYLDFNIHAVNVALVNAVKELKAENDLLKSENGQHQTRIETLESRISKLESLLETISER